MSGSAPGSNGVCRPGFQGEVTRESFEPRVVPSGILIRPMSVRSFTVLMLLWALWLWPTGTRAGELLAHDRYQLDNGLDVVLHVDRGLPLVALDLSYRVGSMHDGAHPGVAHLVEHLMFRGTDHMADGELSARLYDAGARGTNAATRYDHTAYHTVVPTDQLPLALWLESDRMGHMLPALTDDKVHEEIETTIDEWEDRIDSERDGTTAEAMWSALFPPGHPFHPSPPTLIERLEPSHARDFVGRYYGPANATLILAGDLPADIREQVQRYFGHRTGGTRPAEPVGVEQEPTQERRVVRTSALSSTPMVLMAWPSPGVYEPGDADADVLAATLNADRLLPLLEAEAPEVFVAVHARQLSRRRQSLFVLSTQGVASAEPQRMAEAMDAVLERLRAQSLAPGDLRRARRRFTVDALRGLQRLELKAERMRLYVGAGKSPDWLDEDLARYAAVDEASVSAFIREQLTAERRVVVLAPPGQESD